LLVELPTAHLPACGRPSCGQPARYVVVLVVTDVTTGIADERTGMKICGACLLELPDFRE
jgi:hypothetical protein